jgi:hypothetical protein
MNKSLILLFLACCSFQLTAQKKTLKGINALQEENFGLAKQYFYQDFRKDSCSASFGLSIYFLTPYSYQPDSAYCYLQMATLKWQTASEAHRESMKKVLLISDTSLLRLWRALAWAEFNEVKLMPTLPALERVLLRYASRFDDIGVQATELRDSIAYNDALSLNQSIALSKFIEQYPKAKQVNEAKRYLERLIYTEQTQENTEAVLFSFTQNYPNSPYIEEVWRRIFALYKKEQLLSQFSVFIAQYPAAPQVYIDEAWRQIYKLYMRPYSVEKLTQFKSDYPAYPFMQDLVEDGFLLQKNLYPFIAAEQYGYMDAEGKIIIEPQYQEANAFIEDFAIVAKNDKYGLINKKNEPITDFTYLDISVVKTGYVAEDSTGYFLSNFQGKWQHNGPLQWEELQQMLAAFEGDQDTLTPNQAPIFEKITQNGKIGLKKAGKVILPAKYDEVYFGNTNDWIIAKVGKILHYFDATGKRQEINGIEWFANANELAFFSLKGFAVFCKGNKYGLIDKKGKVVVKNTYDAAQPSFQDFYPFQVSGKWGLVSTEAQVLLPFQYQRITPFSPYGFLIEQNGNIGLFNVSGKWVLQPEFRAIKKMDNDFFLIENEAGLGIANTAGTILVPCAYQRIVRFDENTFQLYSSGILAYYLLQENKLVQLQQ